MRGAAVDAGTHRLVYSYRPRSFLIGLIVSLVGLAAFVILGAIGVIGPTRINYARIIPLVDYTARTIGRLVG